MSDMDFSQIAALKVFAELGQLIEEDEKNQVTILNIPDEIINNHISKYLLEDKQINKIFNEKDDYYLLNMLFGYIPNLIYIGPNTWNEYKPNTNLECVINHVNKNRRIKINKFIVKYFVSYKKMYDGFTIKVYNNETELGYINSNCQIRFKNKKEDFLYNAECRNTLELLKNEIVEYINNYRKN